MTGKARIRKIPSMTAKMAVLVVACGLGVNAVAASGKYSVCDRTVREDMQRLDVTVQDLSLNVVDHAAADTAAPVTESQDLPEVDIAAVAPNLTLSPRVASILDYVFSYDGDDAGQALASSKRQDTSETGDPSVAEEEDASAPGAQINATIAEEDLEIPRLQERMYRKDI